jgi:hypothetical protein
MPLARRALFALPLLALTPAPAAGAFVLEPLADGATLRRDGVAGTVAFAGGTIRLVSTLALGSEAVAAVGVARESGGATLDLFAFCGTVHGALQLLGIEVAAWHGANGAHLATRAAATADGSRIVLQRQAALPRSPTLWRREVWTDYLGARADDILADAPVHPPLAGTMQAALAGLRARGRTWLATPRHALTPADLAAIGLDTATFAIGA